MSKRTAAGEPYDPNELFFTHGVASGDPYEKSVILWTRVSPQMESGRSNITVSGLAELYDHEHERYVDRGERTICIEYTIWDAVSGVEADRGSVRTSSDIDFTVKVIHPSALGIPIDSV